MNAEADPLLQRRFRARCAERELHLETRPEHYCHHSIRKLHECSGFEGAAVELEFMLGTSQAFSRCPILRRRCILYAYICSADVRSRVPAYAAAALRALEFSDAPSAE